MSRYYIRHNQHKDFVTNSTYAVGLARVSDSANELVIELSGTPTYGLLKLFEDGFPIQLLLDVAPENLVGLEVGYFNSEMGVSTWRPITNEECSAIIERRGTGGVG